MKILIVGADSTSHEIVEHINNFSDKERGIVIVAAHIGVGRQIAMEITKNLEHELIIVDNQSTQKDMSGGIGWSQLEHPHKEDLIMHIENTMLKDDMDAILTTTNHVRNHDIAQKKAQEKLRRKHYKQGKISHKKKR